MITASNEFIAKINSDSRTFKARFLVDGNALSCDITDLKLNKGAGKSIVPGAIYVPYFDAELANCDTSVANEDITLQIGLDIDDSEEFITLGVFRVITEKKTQGKTILSAVGRLGSECSGLITIPAGTTIANAISGIQTETGVTITLKGLSASGSIANAINATCRDALGEIASLLGGFVTDNSAGGIVIAKYGSGSALSVNGDRMTEPPEANSENYTVTGIKVIVSEGSEDEEGTPIPEVAFTHGTPNVIYSTPNMTQALFNTVVSNLEGYSFRPAVVPLALGDPRLEPWDALSVTDPAGTSYTVPCLELEFNFDGGLQTRIDAAIVTDEESETTIKGEMTQAMEQLAADLVTAKDAIIHRAKITDLEAGTATIEKAIIDTGSANNFAAAKLKFDTAIGGSFSAEQIIALDAAFTSVTTGTINASNLKAKVAAFESALVGTLTAEEIKSASGMFETAIVNQLYVANLDAGYANIDFANVTTAAISQAWVKDLFVRGGFVSQTGTVYNLVGVHINGDLIEANTLRADALLLQGENGLYYKINVDALGETTASSDPKYQQALDGSAIVAHSITADQLTVNNIVGTSGWINLAAGVFAYVNATNGRGIVWDGTNLTISADTITLGNVNLGPAIEAAQQAVAEVQSELGKTVLFDTTYTISNGVATFMPHVYQGGEEVTTDYAVSCFTWKYRLIDGSEVALTTKSDRGCDVTITNLGYGGHVIGTFTAPD